MLVSTWSADVCSADLRLRIGFEPETGGQRDTRDAAAGHDGERGAAFGTRRNALFDREIDRQPRQRREGEAKGQLALARPPQRHRRAAISAHPAGLAKTISEPKAGLATAKLAGPADRPRSIPRPRSEEHTSELQSLMRISYAVFCLKNKTNTLQTSATHIIYKLILQL